MSNNSRLLTLLMGSALCLGTACAANDPLGFGEYDTFGAYDTDYDGYWNEEEWADYSYGAIDYNDDNYIDEDEWSDYGSVWYEPYGTEYYGDFADYDTDVDGFYDDDEYMEAYDSDLFDYWDADANGYIDDDEYNAALSTYQDYDEEGIFDW